MENQTLKIEDCTGSSCANVIEPDFYPAKFTDAKPTGIGSEWTASGRSIVFYHQNLLPHPFAHP